MDVADDVLSPGAPMTGASPTVGAVFFMTLLMAAASGLGAVPFFFVRRLSPRLAALANALACGVMLAASFDLVHEGEPHGAILVVVGVCFGAVFIALTQRALRDQQDVKFGLLRGADARKTLLMVGIMTAHSLGEGSGVGVSFGGERGWTQGTLVTLAIGAHNVPEGMAVATVLAARGVSPWKCAGWAVATSLPQPLLAVPAFVFVETFAALLPLGMGFAAGCMIWITVAELLPDALEGADAGAVATTATVAAAALEAFRMWTEALERADAAHLGLPGSTSKFDRPFLGSESVAKGTYGSVPTAAVSAIAAIAADPNPKTENRKRKPKTNTGAGETLTAGSFVPTERSSGGESAVEALERLAAASNSRKAAAMRAAEFARATVGGGGADGNAGELSGELSPTANATGGASGSGDAAAVAALALATLVVPLLCVAAAAAAPRLMPASQAAASHTSRRFRGAARSGTGGARGFVPERAELLGAAAGAGAAVGLGRLADAFRRCRFEDPSLFIPAALGAAVGALAHLLLAERALGRAEAEPRRGDAEKAFLADAKKADDDPERALAGAGPTSGAEASEASDGSLWAFRGAHAVLVWTCVWAGASEGAALAVAAAAHGGHAALPAAARTFPKACVAGWSALAAGGDRWAAARAVAAALLAQPFALLVAWRLGFGADGWAGAGRAGANAVAFQAATAAAMLAASTRTAAPAARRRNRRSADGGAAFGAALAGIALAALGGLCWQTPYCDRSW